MVRTCQTGAEQEAMTDVLPCHLIDHSVAGSWWCVRVNGAGWCHKWISTTRQLLWRWTQQRSLTKTHTYALGAFLCKALTGSTASSVSSYTQRTRKTRSYG